MWLPLAFFLSSALIILGPYIAWKLRVDRVRMEAWESWAAARGFEYVPRSGSLFARVGERVRGAVGGIRLELDLCRVANGDHGALYTRLVATGDELVGTPVEVRRRSLIQRLNTLVLDHWVEIDDADFSEHWLARGERRAEVLAVLGNDLRRALLESRRIEIVRVNGPRVEILIPGEPDDFDVFDRALDVATAAWATNRVRMRLAS
jgi:hypothetical protein